MAKILIVEDDKTSRFLLHRILTNHGYDVSEAVNALEALKMLEEGEKPDLIISDILMPQMDGLEFVEKIKQDPDLMGIPLILCTVLNDRDTVIRAAELGVNHYIVKPLVTDTVLEQIRKLLDGESSTLKDTATVSKRLSIGVEELESLRAGFLKELPERISRLNQNIDLGKIDEARVELSAIASAAEDIGAERLAAMAHKAENKMRDDLNEGEANALISEIEKAAEELNTITTNRESDQPLPE